ncbi:alanine racemase [Aminobacter anthyllidis]|uniref:alanine racemase n=1 Tax=Aminobacter anthyllidis TaxID=1035067 RepID=UPI002453D6FF|nr:alanine racemase [Aminobacter anthyllidis]MDH4984195.1 alanine racemase [Aminobacter anthyllidis]
MLTGPRDNFMLDDRIRGVPPGTTAFASNAIGSKGWHPADGAMSLPVLTLDEQAFNSNRDLFFRYIRQAGAEIAPHAKTPMAPDLARSLLEAGAWGTTVADIRQASVMLSAGLDRLILANEVGGTGGAGRLAMLVAANPQADLHVFADSVASVEALTEIWRANDALPPLRVLVETGAGRGGARTLGDANAIVDAILGTGSRLVAAGVATYEGAAGRQSQAETDAAISGLLDLTADVFALLRTRVGADAPLILSAGGSVFFDKVVSKLAPVVARDGNATLVLRSGAIFFHDNGVYDRAMATIDERNGFALGGLSVSARQSFRPALRLWAEVLSHPEPGTAICGMGMRDVSFDQGFPVVVGRYRSGKALTLKGVPPTVVKLNDQHAFLSLASDSDLAVGDVLEFGISHPCTCLDRYRVIYGVDETGHVRNAFPTYFG